MQIDNYIIYFEAEDSEGIPVWHGNYSLQTKYEGILDANRFLVEVTDDILKQSKKHGYNTVTTVIIKGIFKL